MKNYTLTFTEWYGPVADHFAACVFRVAVGPISFPLKVEMTATLYAQLRAAATPPPSDDRLRQLMLSIALPRLRTKLGLMEAPSASTDTFLLAESFDSRDNDAFSRSIPSKRCGFQERTAGGFMCGVSAPAEVMDGKTSAAICQGCDLPDDTLRCTNLHHPSVAGSVSHDGYRRRVASAFCDIKTSRFDYPRCIPGGNDCWRQAVAVTPVDSAAPADLPERFVDELQFLNLGFRQAFGHRLLRLNDPRSIMQMASACGTQEAFTTNVACLVDLLNNLDLSAFADEIGPEPQGSLARLEAFLRLKGVLADAAPVQNLRRVVTVRNSFPIHSGNMSFLAAFSELGIPFPPTSWEKAWGAILFQAWKSLRSLRLMIPTGGDA